MQSRAHSPVPRAAYRCAADTAAADIDAALSEAYTVSAAGSERSKATYWDTVDWRLYARGKSLAVETGAGPTRLHLSGPDTELSLPWDGRRGLAFASDLPEGELRDTVSRAAWVRRLLPVLTVRAQRQRRRVLDDLEKTVVRLEIVRAEVTETAGGKANALETGILVTGVRGYDRELADVVSALEGMEGVHRAEGSTIEHAVAALGRDPGAEAAKLPFGLSPDMLAGEATRRILLVLLDRVEQHEEGTRKDLDSEFLHQLRVAVRQSRSAVSQIKGVLPTEMLARFRPELSWLGKATGPTRDLDVYLLKMPAYEADLPEDAREHIAPLEGFLRTLQRKEQRKLLRVLSSRRFERFKSEWREALEGAEPRVEPPPNARRPAGELASERTHKIFRRVLKRGSAIKADTPAEALHDLRIECKKLRYLITFFAELYPSKLIKKTISDLKVLQDNLGDFNDLEVQQDALTDFARQMAAGGDTPAETLLAMGRLVQLLARRQQAERERFAERFRAFSSEKNRARFAKLFGGGA